MKSIIIAIDSFKGCLSSIEANQAAVDGALSVCPDAEVVQLPVSDGGEGFLEAFHAAMGGRFLTVPVMDPLMRGISARYLLNGHTAVLEVAQTIGLTLLSPEERNPVAASSYGVGQLVEDAVKNGARHVIVGLGGSATIDAGRGMLQALTDIGPESLRDVRFTIAADVDNPLCGENGAAMVFGPQKGATPQMVRLLDEKARQFAAESAERFGFDRSGMRGAGAAGGLGYAFMQYLDAEFVPGAELLLRTTGFDALVADAALVITGEGAADRQTLMGKLPMCILQHSGRVPVCLIAGRVNDRPELLQAGFSRVECINPPGLALEEAMKKEVAKENIRRTVRRMLSARSPMTLYEAMLAAADPSQVPGLSRFFKTGPGQYGEGDKFLGIKVPVTRAIVKAHWKELAASESPFTELERCITSEYHEVRLAALLSLVELFSHAGKFPVISSEQSEPRNLKAQCISFYLSHTQYINNWDLVDLSCYPLLGEWLLQEKDRSILYRLARDGRTIWEQRIGIVSTMTFIRHGQLSDTFAIADILLDHPHDLIHKAVGWLLREAGKRDLAALEAWLRGSVPAGKGPRFRQMPRTMLRYAIEKFPEDLRNWYLKGGSAI